MTDRRPHDVKLPDGPPKTDPVTSPARTVSRRSLFVSGAGVAAVVVGGAVLALPGNGTEARPALLTPAPSGDRERVEVATYLVTLAPDRLGPKLRPWRATVDVDPDDRRIAAAALSALLEGPDDDAQEAGFVSAIPAGITLVSAELAGDDAPGVVRVEFSPGWLADPDATDDADLLDRLETPAAGQPGTDLERTLRLRMAQVVFTLTQFETITAVEFILDQETLGAISALGSLNEDDPKGRDAFEDVLPLVMVEDPLALDTVGATFEVSGSSNTFEASLALRLVSPEGDVLLEEPLQATSGNGVRGTFATALTVPDGTAAGPLTLLGFEYSARDGGDTNIFEVSLDFDPEA